jgi:hypothetical protein
MARIVEEKMLLRGWLGSPFAVHTVVLLQIVAMLGYLVFWLSGPVRPPVVHRGEARKAPRGIWA